MHARRTFKQRPSTSLHRAWGSRVRFGLVTAGLLVLAAVHLGSAHSDNTLLPSSRGAAPTAESLTQELMALHARYRLAGSAERAQRLENLLSIAATRQQLLAELIEDNPSEVLRVALPTAIYASLPPAVQVHLEEEVVVEGVLEVLVEERALGSRYLYFLEAAGKRFSLHFATESPTLLSGSRVRVTGIRINEALALASGSTSVQELAVTLPNTFGEQTTLVMLVNFEDNPTQPYTVEDAWSVMFGTTNDFFLENSYQQTWLTGDVAGWYTIPLDSTVCDYHSLATYAKSAAEAAGFNLVAYNRYVYAFPLSSACGFWGLALLGGSPSQAWINGDFELGVTAHELAHGLGLFHSHSMECGDATLGPSCTTYEYGDSLDMMGFSTSAHFNAFQKERLGWLDYGVSPLITTVQESGIYPLGPYEVEGLQANAMKILKSTDPTTGKKTWYYIEYRQAIGFDGFLSANSNVTNGIVVRTGSESSGNSSYLLDMTPESESTLHFDWRDPALVVGESFSDPDSGVTITPLSFSSTGATVSVSFQSAVSVSTDRSSYSPNQSVSMTAVVLADGGLVDNANVTFTITNPNGAMTTGTATTGSDGKAVYKYRLRKKEPLGRYQVTAEVSLSGDSSTANTSFMVQ